jgi:hypothetical protein
MVQEVQRPGELYQELPENGHFTPTINLTPAVIGGVVMIHNTLDQKERARYGRSLGISGTAAEELRDSKGRLP